MTTTVDRRGKAGALIDVRMHMWVVYIYSLQIPDKPPMAPLVLCGNDGQDGIKPKRRSLISINLFLWPRYQRRSLDDLVAFKSFSSSPAIQLKPSAAHFLL